MYQEVPVERVVKEEVVREVVREVPVEVSFHATPALEPSPTMYPSCFTAHSAQYAPDTSQMRRRVHTT